jgi:phosphoglycolate phosphatase
VFRDIKLIIYDLDGVLIDSSRAILESFRRTMMEVGEPFKPDLILERIGYSLYQVFRDIMPPEYHDRVEELRQAYIRHFQSLDISYIRLLPEMHETVAELTDRGFMQAVATNKTASEAERILSELGVGDHFDLIAGFMTVAKPKPEPDMIHYILDKLDVNPNEAVLVDDTDVGLTAGIRAGVYTVGITTGFNSVEQILSVNPSTVIEGMSELPKILE